MRGTGMGADRDRSMSIRARLTITDGVVLLLAGAALLLLVGNALRHQALEEAQAKARMYLDRNLATHAYFTHRLKPTVFRLAEGIVPEDYFDPIWMSSTYAVREMDTYFSQMDSTGYYYKECAVNARNPGNEADPFEGAFLEELNRDPRLAERAVVRRLDGVPYFQVLRRGETIEADCLRCHSDPETAPVGLVEVYGAERSFNRRIGETVSAVSIRIPLAQAFAQANRITLLLSIALIGLLVLMTVSKQLYWGRWLLQPIDRIRRQATTISENPDQVGSLIDLPSGRELGDLAGAFNNMSTRLRRSHDHLEERVRSRTTELEAANTRLVAVLKEVKTLKGMLPICSNCKKIRDDSGYWNLIEDFIRDHSEAEFSHGICPDCFRKLYPDMEPPG
jgi:hypothetical protein